MNRIYIVVKFPFQKAEVKITEFCVKKICRNLKTEGDRKKLDLGKRFKRSGLGWGQDKDRESSRRRVIGFSQTSAQHVIFRGAEV